MSNKPAQKCTNKCFRGMSRLVPSVGSYHYELASKYIQALSFLFSTCRSHKTTPTQTPSTILLQQGDMNSDNVPSTQWIPALLTMPSAHLDPIIWVSSKETNWISAGIWNWKLASNDASWPCCERSLDINQASLCLLWQIGLCCALRYQHYQGHQIYLGLQSCLIQFQSRCNLESSKFLHRFSNFCLMFTGFMLLDSLFL